MASLNKQHKRAQRAKAKAKQTRIQRAATNNVSLDFIDCVTLNHDKMILGSTSIELSVEEREGCLVMTARIDHDEVYGPSTGHCKCCLPTNRDR